MTKSRPEGLWVFEELGELFLEDGHGVCSVPRLDFFHEVSQFEVSLVEVQGIVELECLLELDGAHGGPSTLGVDHEDWSRSYLFQMLHRFVAETVLS
jgi:hypothetical protein